MPSPIRKAVIPIAGQGTRMRPITFAVPKAMLPITDGGGRVLPVLHHILAEVAAAGIERAGVIVSPAQDALPSQYLSAVRQAGCDDLPAEVTFIVQDRPRGFGDAALQAARFVGDEPFLLLLGDHVYRADPAHPPCAAQVAAAFAQAPNAAAMIGTQPVGIEELPRVGTARGEPMAGNTYHCTDFIEKPDLATAADRLRTPDLPEGQFLAHCGLYAFAPVILDLLTELAARRRSEDEEVELADAQSLLLARRREDYYLHRIAGTAYDTGTPPGYAAAQAAFVN